ncbi:MAG: aldo/keto reductase [Nitrospirales bacterium]
MAPRSLDEQMDYREVPGTGLKASVIGQGTWVMGGWLWGGAEDRESLATIRCALELGVNLIDTAPIYGHGRSEELVGKALAESGRRDDVILATKVGLNWNPEKTLVWRESTPARIQFEIEASLRRLRTDRIDLYQVHWPDTKVPFEQTMETLVGLQRQGKIRFIGLSNFDVAQMARCLAVAPVQTLQPPYNLFERGIEADILPFCRRRHIGTLIYSPLCRGLLSGKYRGTETFPAGDVRAMDPKFQPDRFPAYVTCVDQLKALARRGGRTVGQLAIRWCLEQPGVTVALCGARRPDQLNDHTGAVGWSLTTADLETIDRIVTETDAVKVGPEFMAPH